jgi:sulfur carrier protein ThiS
MITITNRQSGLKTEIPGPKSVHDLLLALRLLEGSVLVMHRGELVTRDTRILDGEHIEIIPVVSGG